MRVLLIFLTAVLVVSLLLPAGGEEASRSPEGLAVPVRFVTSIRRIIPVPLLVAGGLLMSGSVEGELGGLPVKGDFRVHMVQASLPVPIFSIPIYQRTRLEPTTLKTPAGTVVVYGAVFGKNMDRIFVEADPEKGTGAFNGVAARGTLNATRLFRGGGEFSGQVVFSWTSKDAAIQAISGAVEVNPELRGDEREDLLSRVRQAIEGAAISPFPPSPVAMNPPKEQQAAPSSPQVEWNVKADGARFEGSVRVVVPRGPTEQRLRVAVVRPDGVSEVHSGLYAPGQRVEIAISGVLPAVIQVYLDYVLIGQIRPEAPDG